MFLNRKTNLVAFLTIMVVLCQVHFNTARPNSNRENRRSIQNKPRDNKTKRGWPVSPPIEEVDPIKEEILLAIDESITERNDAETKPEPTVVQPRKWMELEGLLPSNVRAKLNSDLVLECIAVGSPPPSIHWLKDGKPIENVTPFGNDGLSNHVIGRGLFRNTRTNGFAMAKVMSKIPLRCLKPEDNGVTYTCVAENDGRQIMSTTTVTIDEEGLTEVRPECESKSVQMFSYSKKGRKSQPAYVALSESLHMEAIGKDIVIICHGAGRPHPQISWTDCEGRKIVNGKKFHVGHNGNLVIRNLSWNEMGEYTCSVQNQFGQDSASTFLYPLLTEES